VAGNELAHSAVDVRECAEALMLQLEDEAGIIKRTPDLDELSG
jgi:hypothetical protein